MAAQWPVSLPVYSLTVSHVAPSSAETRTQP